MTSSNVWAVPEYPSIVFSLLLVIGVTVGTLAYKEKVGKKIG
jgi:hypothetical protein